MFEQTETTYYEPTFLQRVEQIVIENDQNTRLDKLVQFVWAYRARTYNESSKFSEFRFTTVDVDIIDSVKIIIGEITHTFESVSLLRGFVFEEIDENSTENEFPSLFVNVNVQPKPGHFYVIVTLIGDHTNVKKRMDKLRNKYGMNEK